MPVLTSHRFKSLVRAKEALPADVVLRKDAFTLVEQLDDRVVRFTISTAAIDRERDSVAVEGWDLDAYRQNPVVLWAHDGYELPIGRCVEIGTDGAALRASVEFVPADMPCVGAKAEAVLRMCRTGFLSTTSVGFRPLEFELAKDRMDDDDWFPPFNFVRQELMEFSIVTIPCNPEALIDPAERRELILPPVAPVPDQALAAAAAEQKRLEEEARVTRLAADRARRAHRHTLMQAF